MTASLGPRVTGGRVAVASACVAALATLAVAALALLALAAPPAAAKKRDGDKGRDRPEERPNVILVVTDDQTLGMLNSRVMPKTVRLLQRRGTEFTNAIATTPLCCPSRASMLTGQYGHNNGVLDNKYRLLNKKRNVLPVWLRKAGYKTAHIGRFLNGYERAARSRTRVAFGWDQWFSLIKPRRYYGYTLSVNGRNVEFGTEPDDYLTTVLNQRAVKLINRLGPKDQPFYMQIDHFAPHTSGGENGERCLGAAVPGPADKTAFQNEPLPRPPSFNEDDVSDKPSFIRAAPKLDADAIENVRRRYGCALASLREVDRGVRQIDRSLKAIGERKRTVLMFVSDNGFYYGEHRLPNSKNYPYEPALRLPFLIKAPKRYLRGATPPDQVDAPVANIDIAPTILQLAGAEPCRKRNGHRCRTMDGRSLLSLLRGEPEKFPADRALIVELGRGRSVPTTGDGDGTCAYRGVRVPGHVYIEHTYAFDRSSGTCIPILERELYDFGADPFQLSNQAIADSTASPPPTIQAELQARLDKRHDCSGIRGRDDRQRGQPYCE